MEVGKDMAVVESQKYRNPGMGLVEPEKYKYTYPGMEAGKDMVVESQIQIKIQTHPPIHAFCSCTVSFMV